MKKNKRLPLSESLWLVRSLLVVIVVTISFISFQIGRGKRDGLGIKDYILPSCTSSSFPSSDGVEHDQQWLPSEVARAFFHYTMRRILPQHNKGEIDHNKGEIDMTMEVFSMRGPDNYRVLATFSQRTSYLRLGLKAQWHMLAINTNTF